MIRASEIGLVVFGAMTMFIAFLATMRARQIDAEQTDTLDKAILEQAEKGRKYSMSICVLIAILSWLCAAVVHFWRY